MLGLGIAVNDRRKNQQTGEWEDFPNFVDCTMFGTRAEHIKPYLQKGSKVAIEGKLRWSQWEAKDGQKRSKLEVVIDEIELLSRSNGSNDSQGGSTRGSGEQAPESAPAGPYDAEIPF